MKSSRLEAIDTKTVAIQHNEIGFGGQSILSRMTTIVIQFNDAILLVCLTIRQMMTFFAIRIYK